MEFGGWDSWFPHTFGFTHDDVIKWKHFPRYWLFVRGIHRSPVNYPHKGLWRRVLMFSLICAWTKGWANHRDAGDLRRHRAHYDVNVIDPICSEPPEWWLPSHRSDFYIQTVGNVRLAMLKRFPWNIIVMGLIAFIVALWRHMATWILVNISSSYGFKPVRRLPTVWTNVDIPDSKVHGANMVPTWVLSAPDGPHVGPTDLAIRDIVDWNIENKFQWNLSKIQYFPRKKIDLKLNCDW